LQNNVSVLVIDLELNNDYAKFQIIKKSTLFKSLTPLSIRKVSTKLHVLCMNNGKIDLTKYDYPTLLKQFMKEYKSQYDYILIDSRDDNLLKHIYNTIDYACINYDPQTFSNGLAIQQLAKLQRIAAQNKSVKLLAAIFNKFDKTSKTHQDNLIIFLSAIKNAYPLITLEKVNDLDKRTSKNITFAKNMI
jgi:cellulose biosynthesis protein BcsQ